MLEDRVLYYYRNDYNCVQCMLMGARDEYGLFGVDYSGECCDPKKWLLTQAAMVEMYARLAILNCNL